MNDLMSLTAQIILWVCAAAGVGLALFSFVKGGPQMKTPILMLVMASAAVWSICIAVMLASAMNVETVASLNLISMPATLVAMYGVVLLNLSFTHVNPKQLRLIALIAAIPAVTVAVALAINHDYIYYNYRALEVGGIIERDINLPGLIHFGGIVLVYFILMVVASVRAWREARTREGKKTMLFVMIGSVISVTLGLGTSFVLPAIGVTSYNWIAPCSLMIYAAAAYLAIVRFGNDKL